mmetsp:Transcript_32191/g.96718  ORF Transcript_32191/g.96718 Transcript_32191/m.96718 type:complete len:267 (-) Transcript_32191:805-1605(-)
MSFVSWMILSACAICASSSNAALMAARSMRGTVAETSSGVFLYLRFFFVGAASAPSFASASGLASSFDSASLASLAALSSALASPPFASSSLDSAGFSAGVSSSGTSWTSCADATDTVPWTPCDTLTRTRDAPAGTPRIVNSPTVWSQPGGSNDDDAASYAATILKSSPRRNVSRFVEGVSPFFGKSSTSEPDASGASPPSSASSVSMGAGAAAAAAGASHDSDTPKGVASSTWYSLTLKRGLSIAACIAQPFDVHSSALSVVLRP